VMEGLYVPYAPGPLEGQMVMPSIGCSDTALRPPVCQLSGQRERWLTILIEAPWAPSTPDYTRSSMRQGVET
jgi:hypothetical protein